MVGLRKGWKNTVSGLEFNSNMITMTITITNSAKVTWFSSLFSADVSDVAPSIALLSATAMSRHQLAALLACWDMTTMSLRPWSALP